MLSINAIKKGIVIDHIKAGLGMKIFYYLGLDKVEYPVALIMNVNSDKNGKKDIIKIENTINIDLAALGFIDPGITIDIIENEKVSKKLQLNLPEKIENVIQCKNPRCITSIEQEITHSFYLVDSEKGTYRCQYCDEVYKF
ncbi:aspartate carbamoyltransferase regulatory subunit [Hathewaya limosa]|uniref:Aspartate carbamoyltransferase regulatory subunit n=1 Tax=Hathewaya limosa TaxID=1536 RepID=A0ABU0JSR7_HATLI|nr:aspartate carbamoyltransferase regulatory subunit [Hathewaya limosa]AWZ47984.1 aspartate carbamoyltransferase regulatory subunit [Clostridiaceae bacterium 14S0207]MDQ0479291.1 aspartate carbamoyltransferase regulatory subunit [Hathewaya limosa]